jgi:hypothetical protein
LRLLCSRVRLALGALRAGTGTRVKLALSALVFLLGGILFGWPILSRATAWAVWAQTASETRSTSHGRARSVEFLWHQTGSGLVGQARDSLEPCDGVCRKLLLDGEVDWVGIYIFPASYNNVAWLTARRRYVRATGAACDKPGVSPSAERACVVEAEDHDEQADLRVDLVEEIRISRGNWVYDVGPYDPIGVRTLTIERPTRLGGERLVRRNEFQFDVVSAPTTVCSKGSLWSTLRRPPVFRTRVRFGAIDTVAALRSVGFVLAGADSGDAAPPEVPDEPVTTCSR